jgi:hypothetical protein
VLVVVGGLIALCSLATLAALMSEAGSGGDGTTQPAVYAASIVLVLAGIACGGYMLWQGLKRRPAEAPTSASGQSTGGTARSGPATTGTASPDPDAERERRILQFAEAEHGRVTVAEVATHCGVTVAQAKADLDRLVQQQVAELQVTERGVLVYVFPGFLSDDEKKSAHDF